MNMQTSATAAVAPMAIEVPPLGESISEAEVITLLAAPGDLVRAQQSLAELGSDKANVQIEATASGRILECLVRVGQKVAPGTALFRIDPSIDVPDTVIQKPSEQTASDTAPPPVAQQPVSSATQTSVPASEPLTTTSTSVIVPKTVRPYRAEQAALIQVISDTPIVLQRKLKLTLVGEHPGATPHLAHIVGALTTAMVKVKQQTTYGWPCGHHHPHGYVPDADVRIGLIVPSKQPIHSLCLRDLDSKNAIGHRQLIKHAMTHHPVPKDLEPAGVTLVFLAESRTMMQLPVFPMTSLTMVVACAPKPSDRRRASLRVSLTADARGCGLLDPVSFLEAFASALLPFPIASAVGFLFATKKPV